MVNGGLGGEGGGTGEKHTESLLRAEALNEKYSHRKNPHIATISTKVKVINFKSVLNRFFLWVGTLSGSRSTEKQEIRWPH